jgi:iron(III) transport system substrate-binding protein
MGRRAIATRRALVALAASLGLLPLLLSGCSSKPRDAITVYSGRGQNLIEPLLNRFAEDAGISVDVSYGDSADLALRIAQEGKRTSADVFISQSPGTVGFLAGTGLLARLDADVLERVDPAYRSDRGLWVGLSGRQRVLVYNKDLVAPADLPASVFDLTDVKYAGKVGLAPSNASFQDFVTGMRAVAGDDETRRWLTAMERAGSTVYPNNNAIVAAVGRGEIPMGLANHYYNFRALEEDPKLPSRNHAFEAGDLGGLLLVSTATILEPSGKKDKATRLVEFLLSKEAQEYFTQEDFEYPLAGGVAPRKGLPPLDPGSSPKIDLEDLGDKLDVTLELIEQSGLRR